MIAWPIPKQLCLGAAYADERQCAERAETTGNEARAAQETAPVEAAIDLAREGGEVSAPSLTIRSLDQHGCLPFSSDND